MAQLISSITSSTRHVSTHCSTNPQQFIPTRIQHHHHQHPYFQIYATCCLQWQILPSFYRTFLSSNLLSCLYHSKLPYLHSSYSSIACRFHTPAWVVQMTLKPTYSRISDIDNQFQRAVELYPKSSTSINQTSHNVRTPWDAKQSSLTSHFS